MDVELPENPGNDRLSGAHWVWWALIFACGLAFVFTLPPYRSNDEYPHWVRTMSVAQGYHTCRLQPPEMKEVRDLLLEDSEDRQPRFTPTLIAEAHARSYLSGRERTDAFANACHYWPVAYVPLAVVAKLTLLLTDNLLAAYYASRTFSWVLMSLVILWAIHAMAWGRSFILAFYSIPEVMQQTTALNNEILLFPGALLVIFLFFGRTSAWRTAVLTAVIAALSVTKVVFYPLIGFLLPHLWALRHRFGKTRTAVAVSLGALAAPALLWKIWYTRVDILRYIWLPPWDVDPARQKAFLLEHPLHLFTIMFVQLKDTFGEDLMRGSWKSVFAGLGNSAVPMPAFGYAAIILCLLVATTADLAGLPLSRARFEPLPGRLPTAKVFWGIILAGIAASIPLTVLAMYLYFTTVGVDRVLGVQGRYYLPPLILFGLLAIWNYRGRLPKISQYVSADSESWLIPLAVFLGVVSAICANFTVVNHYWLP